MLIISNVLRPFWLKSLNEVCGHQTSSFKAWLTNGYYVLNNVGAKGEVSFYTATIDSLVGSFAHDVNRMAMAAFESIYGVPSPIEIPRSTAWTLIRCYYSAFYSAHALCRLFTRAVSQLDQPQITKLNQALAISSNATRLQAGMYRVEIDFNNQLFTLIPLKNRSHEETWAELGSLLNCFTDELLNNSYTHTSIEHIHIAVAIIIKLLDTMKTPPCANYNWLSHIRNELNYRHLHGAWYPHDRVSKFKNKIEYYAVNWKKNPVDLATEEVELLASFSQCCSIIISIAREIILDMSNRNSSDNSFLKYGALRLLK